MESSLGITEADSCLLTPTSSMLSQSSEGDRGGERRRGAGAAVSRGMRRRPLLPLLLLALLRAHGLLAASGEADYTLDDSFWNEESPVGEVERLLREYRQNQELVRNIGAHYYQIIYPVQLRHHEKMGISTREVNTPKGRGYDYQQGTRSRARTGKHFHRTSLLIKAFNHKFRLDLELNTQLLAPNLKQTQYLANGAESDIRTEIEHCYYHGTVKDYPGASAAFHTCNGVSGVIHIGNETFVIHPFYGGDLSKHPHVIFEARTKANKGCANKLEFRPKSRRTKHVPFVEEPLADDPGNMDSTTRTKEERAWRWWQDAGLRALNRRRRDVRETTKYIETALVIDKAMFDRRNGSTRSEVVHDAIQVANIADLYFRTLNTRVSLVYIESWQSADQADIDRKQDITRAIHKFSDYTARKLFKIEKDTTQLLTGLTFPGGESGISVPDTLCTPKSVGISVDTNTYEPHLLAGTMAHMIGHNIGMGHDDGREQCFCRDWHGCIMAQSIVGSDNVQPYKFSDCSKNDYINELRVGQGLCLLNKPNELVMHHLCGNGRLDEGEECDCGTLSECQNSNPCCDPFTCRLTKESQCASGECCERCQLKPRGVTCRDATNECDLEETCTGLSGVCPPDAHRKNGEPCQSGNGACFAGQCPTLSLQCEKIWGQGSLGAKKECFEEYNSKGTVTGHCGKDNSGHFIKCDPENARCGSLQCQLGNRYPIVPGMDDYYTKIYINNKGTEFECKATTGLPKPSEIAPLGLVRDGTPCGDNLVCVNQTCTSIFTYIDHINKCPTDDKNNECSGKGVCSNLNQCVCNRGWTGPDCSHHDELPPSPTPYYVPDNSTKAAYNMTKKETPYENYHGSNTVFLVAVLMSVVGGVFIVFALSALCYRKKSTSRKYDPPYVKKPIAKSFAAGSTTSNNSQEDISLDGGKMHSFNNTFSRGDSQRVIFRHGNHMSGSGSTSRYPDHKQMKRVHSGSEDEPTHSGEEDIAFIDVAQNSMAKLPEKGILKKHGYGAVDGKDKWGDDSQSEQLEAGSQSDGQEPAGAVADMEYKFKDLNGYHENIIVALKTAAAQRAAGAGGIAVGSGDLRALQEYEYNKRERAPSAEKIHETELRRQRNDDEEDEPPQCGPIRIRNLEDLIRQLEHHSSRHMSPSGSEDIRMSETEADRHYRIEPGDIAAARCRGRIGGGEEESRFGYPRFRGSGRHHGPLFGGAAAGAGAALPPHAGHAMPAPHVPHAPHAPHAPHVPHAAHSPHAAHAGLAGHARPPPDDDALYETADAERLRDAPDSESDEFIQAQQQLARWASEEAVPAARGYLASPASSASPAPAPAAAFPEYTH
ncbi:disintegrin and metalloproteinase domain-containing protein 11 isoform X4 [Spodoptera frugiperda]|uniref:Disintegrin and metalloproteinase domain-containing protein 11 isoform X4 n=1 Tax=Spodoptera frugiperda TaxID=7108 RepID=A0A9R0E5N5_SPOFR|nr:disintegrin and metalloproteinase domain-containing protein 11 isoform X4 [Spodoptera frugiperda]